MASEPSEGSSETVDHVFELLREFDTATFITHAREGHFHGRPMSVADIESDGALWFVTDNTSHKMAEVEAEPRAMLAFQDSRRFLTVNGELEIVDDRQKIKELWKESFKLWFDDENDPRIVLFRFTPQAAEYWDTSGVRGLRYAVRAAKAYVTGEPAPKELDSDVHGKVTG